MLIFEGLKLIKLLHLVEFSCWVKISIFGLILGIFEVKNLRGRDSPLHFKLSVEKFLTIYSVTSSVTEEIPGQAELVLKKNPD